MIDEEKVEYIRLHPNESTRSIAKRLCINRKTVQRYKRKFGFPSVRTLKHCEGRPNSCFTCPYAECVLGAYVEENAEELEYLSIGIPTVRSKKNDEATGS